MFSSCHIYTNKIAHNAPETIPHTWLYYFLYYYINGIGIARSIFDISIEMSGVSSIIRTIEPSLVDFMQLELVYICKSDDAKIDSFWLLILLPLLF